MRWLIMAALVLPLNVNAQTIVDESGASIPPETLNRIIKETSDQFRDPDSTKFRRFISKVNHKLICGEVNAKNSYGAYTGYRLFTVTGNRVPKVLPDPSDRFYEIEKIGTQFCFDKALK